MLTVPDSIKDLLHLDSCKKNIRIHFPNGERADICNDLIVKDSVQFTESLCSQDTLQFGLCESPVFECEVVGVSNITGATIEVSCEIFCDSSVDGAEWRYDLEHYIYPLPYGTFFVAEAKRQSDMLHRKITAYNANFYRSNSNELTDLIYRMGKTSSWTFTPNIFASNMMLSSFSSKSRNLTYTEIVNGYQDTFYVPVAVSDIVTVPMSNVRRRYGIFAICKAVHAGQSIDSLCYCEYPKPNKTVDEINQMILGSHPTTDDRWYSSMFGKWANNNHWDKCGASVKYTTYGQSLIPQTDDWINQVADELVALSDVHYVYPFKNDTSGSLEGPNDLYIIVPYAIDRGFINVDESPISVSFYYEPIVFRDKTDIHIYSVSGFPSYYLSIPTVEKKIKTYFKVIQSWWFIDKTKIDYISAFKDAIELSGQFGFVDHNNAFNMIDLKQQFNLNPSNTLYPSSNLYPEGVTGGKLLPQDYQSCWYEDDYVKPFGMVLCEYKNTSNEDAIYNYYLPGYDETTPRSQYLVYDISENSIIRDKTWTESQIEDICETIANSLEGVTYMPVEFVGRGLPYVEAGDTFEILTKSNDSITTIVLNRTLTGEQVLTDSYKSV